MEEPGRQTRSLLPTKGRLMQSRRVWLSNRTLPVSARIVPFSFPFSRSSCELTPSTLPRMFSSRSQTFHPGVEGERRATTTGSRQV